MPMVTIKTVENDLLHKIDMIRERLKEIVDDQYGPMQSATDQEERQLQGRLAFLEGELERIRHQSKRELKKRKYVEIQARFKDLCAGGLAPQKAIRQIADERYEDEATVKWSVYYKPNRK